MKKEQYIQKTQEIYARMALIEDENARIQLRNRVVELNMPLVSEVLKKYKPYTADQYQVGCMGLIRAADTYNVVKGVPFSSYACFMIERELHKDYFARVNSFESKMADRLLYLNATTTTTDGESVENASLIADTEATVYMEQFIEDNMLDTICNEIIKPAIDEVASRGQHSRSKINFDNWKQLEFRYIMSIVFEESQKSRFNLTTMAKECNISLPNVRLRHMRVMDVVFQRMWNFMALSFKDLLERLRGDHSIPQRLLCFDPGKTTGWCLFENGALTRWGQLEDCYDNDNIHIAGLISLMDEIQPDFILYEDYKVYSSKLAQHSFNPVMPVRLIGTIETYSQMNDILTHKQMATTAKNFCTDAKMESWGFWQKGLRHSRDAIRHGCYFLLFFKRGENIM